MQLLKNGLLVFLSLVTLICFSVIGSVNTAYAETFNKVLYEDFHAADGAGLRTAGGDADNGFGLRFTILISNAKLTSLRADANIDKIGAMIVPESYVTDFENQNIYTDYVTYFEDEKGVGRSNFLVMLDKNSDNITDSVGGYHELRIALTGIKFNNVNRNFVAVGVIHNSATGKNEYSEVSDARSVAFVAEALDEAGYGSGNADLQAYLNKCEKWSAYHAQNVRYDANNDSGEVKYHVKDDGANYSDNLDTLDVTVEGFNAIPISYKGVTCTYLRELYSEIEIVKVKAKETDAYYNDGKDVYSVTDTAGNRDGIEYRLNILAEKRPSVKIKKLTFKMYVSEDFYLEYFYIGYQGNESGTYLKRLKSTYLSSCDYIKLLDNSGNIIYGLPHGNSGWITVEVACASNDGLYTLFALASGKNVNNRNCPVYISELEFSNDALTVGA